MRGEGRGTLSLWPAIALAALALAPSSAAGATITVSTDADEFAGVGTATGCSVREAIASVNAGGEFDDCLNGGAAFGTNDLISIPAGTYSLSINGSGEDLSATGDLDVRKTVTITGTGDPVITQSLTTDDRVLHSPLQGASLTLNGLTLDGGEATGSESIGGNLYFEGDSAQQLTLNNVDVTNGLASNSGGGQGGGIASDGGGDVTIEAGSTVSDNTAGGAIGSAGTGGGIRIGGDAGDLTVSQSQVTGNHAADNGGTGSIGIGGGIALSALASASAITLTDATIDSNHAGGGGSLGASFGGGVYVDGVGPITLTVTGGSISSNTAGGGAAITNMNFTQGAGSGGGLFYDLVSDNSSAELDDVDVVGNIAGGNGGRAQGTGGGIHSAEDLTVTDSNVSSNLAGVDDVGANNGAPGLIGSGGGINSFQTGDLTVTGTTMDANKAGENVGGGGAINISSTGNLTVSDSSMTNGVVADSAPGGGSHGGGIYRTDFSGGVVDSVSNSTITGNEIGGAGAANAGGGIGVESEGTFSVTGSAIADNTVSGATGAAGGGLSFEGSSEDAGAFTVTNTTVTNNTAFGGGGMGRGGGIQTGAERGDENPSELTITNATVAGNGVGTGSGGNLSVIDTITGGLTDVRASIISGGAAVAGAQNCFQESAGDLESLGENIESTTPTQCSLSAGLGDQIGVNPILGALGINAPGTTPTMAIALGSPAVDSVPAAGCVATDQRGVARPQGSFCDAGAFELEGGIPAPPATPATPAATPVTPVTPVTTKKCKKKKKGGKKKKKKCKKS